MFHQRVVSLTRGLSHLDVGYFPALDALLLSENQFTGQIPADYGNLVSLGMF